MVAIPDLSRRVCQQSLRHAVTHSRDGIQCPTSWDHCGTTLQSLRLLAGPERAVDPRFRGDDRPFFDLVD